MNNRPDSLAERAGSKVLARRMRPAGDAGKELKGTAKRTAGHGLRLPVSLTATLGPLRGLSRRSLLQVLTTLG